MYPTNLIKVNLKQSAVISSDLFPTGTCRFSWNDTVPYFMYGTLTGILYFRLIKCVYDSWLELKLLFLLHGSA